MGDKAAEARSKMLSKQVVGPVQTETKAKEEDSSHLRDKLRKEVAIRSILMRNKVVLNAESLKTLSEISAEEQKFFAEGNHPSLLHFNLVFGAQLSKLFFKSYQITLSDSKKSSPVGKDFISDDEARCIFRFINEANSAGMQNLHPVIEKLALDLARGLGLIFKSTLKEGLEKVNESMEFFTSALRSHKKGSLACEEKIPADMKLPSVVKELLTAIVMSYTDKIYSGQEDALRAKVLAASLATIESYVKSIHVRDLKLSGATKEAVQSASEVLSSRGLFNTSSAAKSTGSKESKSELVTVQLTLEELAVLKDMIAAPRKR